MGVVAPEGMAEKVSIKWHMLMACRLAGHQYLQVTSPNTKELWYILMTHRGGKVERLN